MFNPIDIKELQENSVFIEGSNIYVATNNPQLQTLVVGNETPYHVWHVNAKNVQTDEAVEFRNNPDYPSYGPCLYLIKH